MANREREDNIYYARLAEQGERYEDMIRYMKEVANVSDLSPSRECLLLPAKTNMMQEKWQAKAQSI